MQVISRCPVCNGSLKVMRLKCSKCNTVIENEFSFNKFTELSKEQLNFLEVFLMCRGNIKDVEKELKISYPTVRAKLDELISELGLQREKIKTEKETIKNDNNEILDKLEKGEITPDEALELLRK
ncbi:hypothetical protein rsdtw13_41600 [Clostridium sp. TW13]|uniref:Uncharacterized protein n=2 Tax=Inconstantimicrobium mannanitabidum TaxID=1604901 RepID=A0ACB5RIK1_9CLOT|nr:DUF2089 domain-containing protein [Clostridium sp. TW13]GKX68902.1 hypothetical protein rsdtw13_41600 [Clostridium sp. TW13]